MKYGNVTRGFHCGQGSLLLEMEQDREKTFQNPDFLQTTILTPTPSRHPQEATASSRSRAKDTRSLPSAILSMGFPKDQGKVKDAGEERRSKHPSEGSEATPSTLAQQRENGLNPKWVWLFGFSNFCLPPSDVFSSFQVLPYNFTARFSCPALERWTATPALHITHALFRKLQPQQFIWAQTTYEPMIHLSAHRCH